MTFTSIFLCVKNVYNLNTCTLDIWCHCYVWLIDFSSVKEAAIWNCTACMSGPFRLLLPIQWATFFCRSGIFYKNEFGKNVTVYFTTCPFMQVCTQSTTDTRTVSVVDSFIISLICVTFSSYVSIWRKTLPAVFLNIFIVKVAGDTVISLSAGGIWA